MNLIAVTDDKMETAQLVDTLCAIEPSIDAVILREKSKTDAEVIELIQTVKRSGFDASKIIVHRRPDVATIAGIQKVQLPGHGLPLRLAKKQFPSLSFGRSVHSLEEAEAAYNDGADWVLYGHLFATGSKEGLPPRGTEELRRIAGSLPIPVYAIGGIKPKHLSSLQQIGVAGVAVMSTIFRSDEPDEVASSYKEGSYATKR
ncbi:thiamine phosphate synthase [Sporosarcina sp. HYO08]|uniref:thiamine phosphate synthase n=1 Tax=Sporosarcina sp. HYO08 TaxID=1759557 RepID=UPI000793E9DD|nr:thiamine phosphate synthase [Sporosarcina sp. HYO08]KXH80871.1 hypothetical protein AU377_09065 [Sporosarcina sp. HYO08]